MVDIATLANFQQGWSSGNKTTQATRNNSQWTVMVLPYFAILNIPRSGRTCFLTKLIIFETEGFTSTSFCVAYGCYDVISGTV